jgi:hypothetical protein
LPAAVAGINNHRGRGTFGGIKGNDSLVWIPVVLAAVIGQLLNYGGGLRGLLKDDGWGRNVATLAAVIGRLLNYGGGLRGLLNYDGLGRRNVAFTPATFAAAIAVFIGCGGTSVGHRGVFRRRKAITLCGLVILRLGNGHEAGSGHGNNERPHVLRERE